MNLFDTALHLNAMNVIKELEESYKPENKPATIDIRYWTNGNDGTLGFSVGDKIDRYTFASARHKLKLNRVKLAPKTDLIIRDRDVYTKTFRIHNGTDEEKTFEFKWYLPVIYSLKVVEGANDGRFYDSYNWFWYIISIKYLPFILFTTLMLVMIIAMLMNGEKQSQKESYIAPMTPVLLFGRNGSMYQ